MNFFDKIINKLNKPAVKMITNKNAVMRTANKGIEIVEQVGGFSGLYKYIILAINLVKDWVKGSYRGVSKSQILIILGCIIYLVSPLDIIPDFVPIIGFMDDVAIWMQLLARITGELEAYAAWKEAEFDKEDMKKQIKKLEDSAVEEKLQDKVQEKE